MNNSKVYRETLVALIQSLKTIIGEQSKTDYLDYQRIFHALHVFLAVTPPFDCYATRNVCFDFLRRMPLEPSEEDWAVMYELCRAMPGMLDVPYAQR